MHTEAYNKISETWMKWELQTETVFDILRSNKMDEQEYQVNKQITKANSPTSLLH